MPETVPPPSSPQQSQPGPGAAMDRRVARSRMSGLRRWRWPAVAILAVGVASIALWVVPDAGTLAVAASSLTQATVENTAFQDYLPVRATVAPLHTVYVGAVEGGTVKSVAATDGASVKSGDLLAELSNPQLQLDVSSREAAVAAQLGSISAQRLAMQQSQTSEQNGIAETAYDLLKANRDVNIRRHLHDDGFESDAGLKSFQDEAQYYASRLTLLREARVRNTKLADRQAAEIEQTASDLRHNLDVVQGSLQALLLRAPVSGRLTNFALQPGQSLKQGDQIGQIDSENAYRLDADIDEFYLGRVQTGEQATAQFGGVAASLHVARVRPQVTNGQFRAELVFDGAPPPGLRRGESADCRITLGDTQKVLVLPNGPWLEASGGSSVFVLDAGGRNAVRRAIASGRRTPEQVEITSGLEPGERVVTSSYAGFSKFSHILVR